MLWNALIWLWNGANLSIYKHVTHFVPNIRHEADCKISHQLWKEVKVGRTKKNPTCKYYKSLCKFISSLKIAIHVGWGTSVTTCILSRLHMWEFMWEELKHTVELNTKHSDISTKVGPWRKSMRL